MSQEHITEGEKVESVPATPVAVSTPVVAPIAAPKEKLSIKDLLVPLSIVVAGLFVGAGLYFGGGTGAAPAAKVAVEGGAPEVAVDTTNKIDPVTEADHIRGNINAPVKIVEFSDFECPFCKRQHETLELVIKKYGDKVAWVYRQFPLEQLHKKATPVALASECVAELGGDAAFWKFADGYFTQTLTNDRTDIETLIPSLVSSVGVNQAAFTTCFESQKHLPEIEKDIADATETGGRGTPWSVVIGPSGKTYAINGALPQAAIEQIIEKALSEG